MAHRAPPRLHSKKGDYGREQGLTSSFEVQRSTVAADDRMRTLWGLGDTGSLGSGGMTWPRWLIESVLFGRGPGRAERTPSTTTR
jgi:hypothetical protein